MTPDLLSACLDHARAEAPRECCGLFIESAKDTAEYVPCRNISTDRDNHFKIHPQDWVNTESNGRVLGIVHSHPGSTLTPSAVDIRGQLSTCLPWWIVRPDGDWFRFGAAPLTGRTFAWGVNDCFSLVREHCGTEPDFLRFPDFWKARNLFNDYLQASGFELIDSPPEINDVLLMAIHGEIINHCAVYLGQGRMLHHLPGRLSAREPIGHWTNTIKAVARKRL